MTNRKYITGTYEFIPPYIQEDALHNHRCENLRRNAEFITAQSEKTLKNHTFHMNVITRKGIEHHTLFLTSGRFKVSDP
jgi:hypothetical protein